MLKIFQTAAARANLRNLTRSIGTKLLLTLVALSLLPLALTGALNLLQSQKTLTTDEYADLELHASSSALYVDQWLRERVRDVKDMAATARVRTMESDKAVDTVVQYQKEWGMFETLFVVDINGKPVAASDGLPVDISDRPYFPPARQGEDVISDLLVSKSTGNVVFVIAVPVISEGEIIGIAGGVLPVAVFNDILALAQKGDTGEAYLIDKAGNMITRSRFTEELKRDGLIKERSEFEIKVDTLGSKAALAGESGVQAYTDYRGKMVLGSYQPIPRTGWGLLVEVDQAEALQAVRASLITSLAFLAAVSAVIVAAAAFFARRISRPIRTLAADARALAQGDIDRQVSYHSQDELGELADAFRAVIAYQTEISHAADALAAGDLTVQVAPISAQDRLGRAFENMLASLRRLIEEIAASAGRLGEASGRLAAASHNAGAATGQIAATIHQIAAGAAQQSEGISHTAGSIDEMTRAIEGVARGAQEQSQAAALSSEKATRISDAIEQIYASAVHQAQGAVAAAKQTRNGAQVARAAAEGMHAIQAKVSNSAQKVSEMNRRANQIGAIVEVIEDIASQTNLLALNAAIEAARAGEHGLGFAVVASEVRKLAEKAAVSAKEISALIAGIQSVAAETVRAMDESAGEVAQDVGLAAQAGDALQQLEQITEDSRKLGDEIAAAAEKTRILSSDMVDAVDSVLAVVEQNTAATQQMAANAASVAQVIEGIASVSEENSAAVEEVSASTEEMNSQVETVAASAADLQALAHSLQQAVARFRLAGEAGPAAPHPASAPAAHRQPATPPAMERISVRA